MDRWNEGSWDMIPIGTEGSLPWMSRGKHAFIKANIQDALLGILENHLFSTGYYDVHAPLAQYQEVYHNEDPWKYLISGLTY